MGLLDKLKSVKNSITGGGATVQVEIAEGELGRPLPVVVRARAETKLSVRRVYLELSSEEHATATYLERERDGDLDREHARSSYERVNLEIDLAGAQQLEEGGEYTWEGEITLPGDALPSFYGNIIQHLWHARAGLDTSGNDPDSGWVEFEVY